MELNKLSYQYIAFMLAVQEKQIAKAIAIKKDLLAELERRSDYLVEMNRRGEIPMEISDSESGGETDGNTSTDTGGVG